MGGRAEIDRLLASAVDAHRAGRVEEAARGYAAVLERDPRHPDALQLLGSALLRLGHPTDALAVLDRTVSLHRRHAVAHVDRARALLALERASEAIEPAQRATRLRPELAAAWVVLARARRLAGELDSAAVAAERAVEAGASSVELAAVRAARGEVGPALSLARPEGAAALAHVGDALVAAGQPGRAAAAYAEARAIEDSPELCLRHGVASLLGGDAMGALGPLRLARAASREDAAAALALGRALVATRQPADALPHLAAAAERDPAAWPTLVDTLGLVADPPADVGPTLAAALDRPDVDWQRLDRAVQAVIAGDLGERVDDPLALAAHPLVVPWLKAVVPSTATWEARLAAVRRHGLEGALPLPFRVALAVAVSATEHAWAASVHELAAVDALAAVCQAPADPTDEAALHRLATLAGYRSLAGLPWAAALVGADWLAGPLGPLLVVQLVEPAREAELGAALPELGWSGDAISAAVRDQYERNPYPRRFGVQRRTPVALESWLRERFPWASDLPRGPVRALIAGCGTGQHALTSATTFAHERLLAIDLSRASLGCAARRAEELGVELELAHGDLLALDALDEQFDLVESVGVLHHLAAPADGLAALVRRTRPGGVLRIGLYSAAARADVAAARSLLDTLSLNADDPDDLRRARAALQALPDGHIARGVLTSPDFYALSGVRDLVLHACEHCFTVPTLRALLEGAGLELIGFQTMDRGVEAAYDDLSGGGPRTRWEVWEALEVEEPRLFTGMYLVWCRLPRAST